MKELALPLTGGDNRCIRDALGNVVSVPENAEAFAHAMNCHQKMIESLKGVVEHLKVLRGMWREHSTGARNADYALKKVLDMISEAEAGKLPPAPSLVDAAQITDLMGEMADMDTRLSDFAEAIVKKYKVFPR